MWQVKEKKLLHVTGKRGELVTVWQNRGSCNKCQSVCKTETWTLKDVKFFRCMHSDAVFIVVGFLLIMIIIYYMTLIPMFHTDLHQMYFSKGFLKWYFWTEIFSKWRFWCYCCVCIFDNNEIWRRTADGNIQNCTGTRFHKKLLEMC